MKAELLGPLGSEKGVAVSSLGFLLASWTLDLDLEKLAAQLQ